MKKVPKILYLPIETIVRELDANLLITHEALKRGYKVVIGGKGQTKTFAQHVGGGVYLYKHWESEFPFGFDDERRINFFYAGLHQEGLVWIDIDTFFRRMTEKGRSEKLDVNFVKGAVQRELLVGFYPKLISILKEVGDPSFDLLRERYQSLFQQKSAKLRKQYGPYVLINTNFSPGNRSRFDLSDILEERNKASIKNVGRPLTEQEQQTITKSIQYKKDIFEHYRQMILVLSEKFPHITFVLRPHPSEDHQHWIDVLSGRSNVHVLFKDNVVNWILGSELVVHTGCTTAIEAWLLRKPVVRYNPIGEQVPFESVLPNRLGAFAASIEELEQHLLNIGSVQEVQNFERDLPFVKSYLESVDGEPAVIRILNEIGARCAFEATDNLREKADSYRTFRKRLSILWRTFLAEILKRKELTRFLLGREEALRRASGFQKFPAIRRAYVADFLRKLQQLESVPTPRSLRIVRVDTNVLCIENNDSF